MARPTLLRYDEAHELLAHIPDKPTKDLLNYSLFFVLKHFWDTGSLPAADFDVRFFLEVLREAFSDHARLIRILRGEDAGLDWGDS